MAEKIQIQIDAETRQAIANLAKLQTATEDVEKATKKLSVSQRIIETLNTDISKLGGKVGESMRRVSMGVAGGIAAFGALAYKVTEMAAAIEQQEIAINRLGPAYDAMRAATNGVISAQEAMKAQQTLVQAGFRVSTEQLATIARAAREYSRATGTEMTQSLEQLTDALRTGSAEGLGRFGVSLQQGVTGTRAFGSALEQLTAQQEHTATSARTMREDLDKLPEGLMAVGRSIMSVLEGPANALTEWLTGLAGASMNLRGLLSEIAGAGDTIRQRERQEATDRANMQRLAARDTALRNLQALGLADTGALRGLSPERIEALTRRGFQITGSTIGPQAFGSTGINVFRVGRGEASTQIERQALFQAAVEQARQEQAAEEALARLPQGPTRRTTGTRAAARAAAADTQLTAAKQQLVQAQIEARQQGVELVEGSPRALEDTASYLLRLAGEQRELTSLRQSEREKGEAAFAESRRGLETPQERAAREREKAETAFAMIREGEARGRRESFGGRLASALGIELDEQGRVPALDAAQTGAELLGQSLGTLRSGFSELFNTLASGSMSAGEAFQQFAAKTLKSLGEMSINQGIALTFQGIAALFTNPVAAPLMLAGGAGLIALGTGLGAVGAAATPAPPSTGSAAPSAARSASGASPRDIGTGAGNVTIVLSSLVPPGPRELQGLVNAQRQAGRYGIDRDRMVPRQVRA